MRIPVPILLYHSISDTPSPKLAPWTVSPKSFETHIAFLRDAGFTSFTVSEFVRSLSAGTFTSVPKPIVITFDDGYADFYTNALPALNKHEIKSSIYLVTRYINRTSEWIGEPNKENLPMMSWDQVKSLANLGVECGAHSHSHLQLDIIPSSIAEQEIKKSKEILEEKLSQPVNSFAYPHGYHNQKIRSMVQNAGFTSACAVKNALSSTEDDRFALARMFVYSHTDLNALRIMLEGNNIPVAPFPERFRTKLWRILRWSLARIKNRSYT